MAVIDTHNAAQAATCFAWVKAGVFGVLHTVKTWNDARGTRAALSKLTARQLDDIGLTADAIEKIGRA